MEKIKIIKDKEEIYLYIGKLKNKIKQINIKNNKCKITYMSENKREYNLSVNELELLKNIKSVKINELSEEDQIISIYSVNLFFDF